MKEYTVQINGLEHTLQLDAEDAKGYKDAKEVSAKSADKPANKSRTATNKG